MSDDKIEDNDIVIDLGDSVYTGESYTLSSSGIDTITIDPLWNNMATSITIPTSSTTSTTSFTGGNYSISGSNGYTWSNSGLGISNTNANVVITQGGMEIKDGDIKIGERSLTKFMEQMEQRLSILVPDPEKLEQFEALKKAYEHYKTMEALCFPDKKDK